MFCEIQLFIHLHVSLLHLVWLSKMLRILISNIYVMHFQVHNVENKFIIMNTTTQISNKQKENYGIT